MNSRTILALIAVVTALSFVSCSEAQTTVSGGQESNQAQASSGQQDDEDTQVSFEDVPPANALEGQIAQAYQKSEESVVNITVRTVATNVFNQPVPQEGSGSGFVYDAEGHIVTNYHVVSNARTVLVSFGGNEMHEATVVGTDASTDLAVLKVENDQLPQPLELSDSEELRVGQFVIAVGNPFGLRRTLTFGVISALGRVIQSPDGRFISEAIQTDAPVNPGNSGGPLMDLNGNVIGVNSVIISPTGASAGIGFAISSRMVGQVVPVLIEEGSYPHPWMGIEALDLSAGWIQVLKEAGMEIPVETGIYVVNVVGGGPASNSDLRGAQRTQRVGNVRVPIGGDIVVEIDGDPVPNYKELVVYLESETTIGETVTVGYYRDGAKETTELTIGERPEQQRQGRRFP
jgi:S1-C subfamily serine protease